MGRGLWHLLLIGFGLALSACKDDLPQGALEVRTRGLRGEPVPGVDLRLSSVRTTAPDLYSATTDARGVGRFDGLPLQTYELELSFLGRTRTEFVTIAGDSLRRVTFSIDDLPGTDPRILFDLPPPTLARGKALSMSASFIDDVTPVGELRVSWVLRRATGGSETLFDGRPGVFGDVFVDVDSLPVGTNVFSISATDSDGREARNTFTVTTP